ncbi:MAG: arginine repressor [Lachnospiraceae bacterium]|nr:arginine repressor [Lachnospiraceae bacterium]
MAESSNSEKRRQAIMQLIREQEIETQEELTAWLKKQGFDTTQATVSRDIRFLGLSKVPATGGRKIYALPRTVSDPGGKYAGILAEGFISCDTAGHMLVIKTAAGMAMAVAAAVDAMEFEQVVGSIAGDDTVMLAIKNEDAAVKLCVRLRALVGRS